jgi:radical SAM protein with 4Fe4S-binding SPASM domain
MHTSQPGGPGLSKVAGLAPSERGGDTRVEGPAPSERGGDTRVEGPAPSERGDSTRVEGFSRPYVISWNLTYRCNLACEHCYLDAGGTPLVGTENFADRSELGTEECYRVVDEIAAFAPECVTILTGGEPLLRRDIIDIVRYAAARGLWVVVGTNGVRITENVAQRLAEAGARGLSLSLDALDPDRHDRFRRVRGAWRNTVEGAAILNRVKLPFIVQTTAGSHNVDELDAIADFACERLAAKVWNLYFLVPTGRGQFVSDMTPAQYDQVLAALHRIQSTYRGRMLVNAKCAPHYIKTVLENPDAEARIRVYSGGAGGCPAGTHYMGIRPNGDVTPCPYLPVFAGSLRRDSLANLWNASELFSGIRRRAELGGRCGDCEMNAQCGGCRARAYGMTGDLMAEDPLCTHTPGKFAGSPLLLVAKGALPSAGLAARAIEYGAEPPAGIAWDAAASERMKRIPAFVRGMVMKAVEESCRRNGLDRVTIDELERIRARMPTPKIFGAGAP